MTSPDTAQAIVERNGSAVADAVTALADMRVKLGHLQRAIGDRSLEPEQIAAVVASLDASTDAVAQALAPIVADPETPTGSLGTPAALNPETVDPADVPGAVAANEPLPDELVA